MAHVILQKTRGILALVGTLIDNMAQNALESLVSNVGSSIYQHPPFHITIITKEELKSLSWQRVAKFQPDTRHIYPVGIGGNISTGVYYLVVIWAAGQQFRQQLGLHPKQFHITLSTCDDHEMDKSIRSLLSGQFPAHSSPDFLDHLAYTLYVCDLNHEAQSISVQLIRMDYNSPKGYLRLADSALRMCQYKLAMLAYACSHERTKDEKIRTYAISKIIKCSKETEWGTVLQEHEIAQLPPSIIDFLVAPWSFHLKETLGASEVTPVLQLESRRPLYIPLSFLPSSPISFYKLPRFFRWLVPYHIAVMSTPRNEEDIAALASPFLGIRHVLTLTEESPLDASWFHGKPITNTFLPVANYRPPSIEQMDAVIRILGDPDKLPVLIHCGGGKGRAGTVAACYLATYGFRRPQAERMHPEHSAQEAIQSLRTIRPGSIETSFQEEFVSRWCSTIWKRRSVHPHLPSEPSPCAPVIEGSLTDLKETDLIMLVGLPGSGKSWLSNSLHVRDKAWTVISQDELGGRSSCEAAIGRARGKVILDRCNCSVADRRSWLELSSNWSKCPICIWLDYDPELCTSRAQRRIGHPTLPPGNRVRNAVDQMRTVFTQPKLEEGFKGLFTIRSFEAARELVLRLSPSLTIYKFPRTPHLIDLGAKTIDDILTDISTFGRGGKIVITEKLDGANMGFSISSHSPGIIVQNRSHYINSSTHEQFKKLGFWVERHREDLFKVLNRDSCFVERYILFGEWMYATHSIPYTRLPDYFMAYDLYDRTTQTWANRKTLADLLSTTSIQMVPVIHEGTMVTESELRNMVQSTSRFYDGQVEGVYVKVEKNCCVVSRGKVVRNGFIAGNEHWTKGNLRVNGLVKDQDSD